jgi:signal transduction histidine kinase
MWNEESSNAKTPMPASRPSLHGNTESYVSEPSGELFLEHDYEVLASLPDCILIVNEQQTVIYANSMANQRFGLGQSTLIGRPVGDVLPIHSPLRGFGANRTHSPSANHHDDRYDRAFEMHERLYQYRFFPVAWHASKRGDTGIVISDVTEEKHLQDQLIHAQKLSSLGLLMSSMAHEINNPIHGILSMAEILLDETQPEKIKEYAQDIVAYAKHMAALVNDVSRSARPASREREEDVEVSERLLEAVKMVRRSHQCDNVRVVTNFQRVPHVRIRRSEIDQVLVNLISNAVHAMPEGGVLTLTTCVESGHVSALIGDSGTGIPSDLLSRIFDPFFTTKDSGKGAGLGLSIVRRILAKYGGTVTVQSEIGAGSTFGVHFPCTPLT